MRQQASPPNLECSMGKLDRNTAGPPLASLPTRGTQMHLGHESNRKRGGLASQSMELSVHTRVRLKNLGIHLKTIWDTRRDNTSAAAIGTETQTGKEITEFGIF